MKETIEFIKYVSDSMTDALETDGGNYDHPRMSGLVSNWSFWSLFRALLLAGMVGLAVGTLVYLVLFIGGV